MNVFQAIEQNHREVSSVDVRDIKLKLDQANATDRPRMASDGMYLRRSHVTTLLGYAGNYNYCLSDIDYNRFLELVELAKTKLQQGAARGPLVAKLIGCLRNADGDIF